MTEIIQRRLAHKGPLHDLLIHCCPPNDGVQSIPYLAKALGLSNWSVFKWIRNNRIPPKRAQECVKLSQGRVTIEQFAPFVFN